MDFEPAISNDSEVMARTSRPPRPIPESEALSGDFRGALENVSVPSYVIDKAGVIRWVNPAAIKLVGDVRGRHFTSVVAPEETRRAHELFTLKILGSVSVTETEGILLRDDGSRVTLEICAVPLKNGDHIVGVFGQLVTELDEPPTPPHPDLTPRQAQVLKLLDRGHSTPQIADELHITISTVRNHIRDTLRTLGVHSRIEAIAAARGPTSKR